MTDAVRLDAVEIRVDGRTILGPVTLTVRAGEHWVLLGPNGGGKTTLLSVAGAWRQPSRGAAQVLGARIGRTDIRRLRTRIGHVSHLVADRLRPGLSVLDTVLTGKASVLELWWQVVTDDDRSSAHEALRAVGCDGLEDRRLGTCSLGERQRVLIARALFGAHPLLLFDEPAAGLDLPGRERLLAAMTAAAPGRTTLLATHHLEEIPPTSTHAALISDGRVVGAGSVDDVLTDGPLGACFGVDLAVERRDGRWSARARGDAMTR